MSRPYYVLSFRAIGRNYTPNGRFSKQQCYDLQGEINYFTANQQRMDLSAVSVLRSAHRQRRGRGGLQERGGQANEAERDDLVVPGRRQGHASTPRLRDEAALVG